MRTPRVLLAASLAVASILSGLVLGPASATSAAGLAANAWIVSDLAAGALTSPAYHELSAADRALLSTSTTATTVSAGVRTVPKPGVLGMAINTVAVLGGLATMFWPGDSGAPTLPTPAATDVATGSGFCGWTTVSGATIASCTNTGVVLNLNAPTLAGTSKKYFMKWDNDSLFQCGHESNVCGLNKQSSGSFHYRVFAAAQQWVEPGVLLGEIWVPQSGAGVSLANPMPGTSPNPALVPRHLEARAECKRPDGTSEWVTTISPVFYVDPANPSTAMPTLPDLACPAGTFLNSGTRVIKTNGQPDVPVAAPYAAPGWVQEQATDFPECFPIGSLMCQLKLFKLPKAGSNPEYDCNSYAGGAGNPCLDWWTDPNKRENYECRFGATPVAFKRCEPYKQLWTTGVVTPTPDVETPEVPVGVDPTPELTPELGNCVPGWSELLSPWWVFKATACALSWAFVPETALSTRLDRIRTGLANKIPFAWVGGLAGVPVLVPSSGCPDWKVKVGDTTKDVICNSSYIDSIRTARPILGIFMGALALWPLIRSTAYASMPVIKPTPGNLR